MLIYFSLWRPDSREWQTGVTFLVTACFPSCYLASATSFYSSASIGRSVHITTVLWLLVTHSIPSWGISVRTICAKENTAVKWKHQFHKKENFEWSQGNGSVFPVKKLSLTFMTCHDSLLGLAFSPSLDFQDRKPQTASHRNVLLSAVNELRSSIRTRYLVICHTWNHNRRNCPSSCGCLHWREKEDKLLSIQPSYTHAIAFCAFLCQFLFLYMYTCMCLLLPTRTKRIHLSLCIKQGEIHHSKSFSGCFRQKRLQQEK